MTAFVKGVIFVKLDIILLKVSAKCSVTKQTGSYDGLNRNSEADNNVTNVQRFFAQLAFFPN